MAKAYARQDADLIETIALPAAAGSASTPSIDLGGTPAERDFVADHELEIAAPAISTTGLIDGATMVYKVEESSDDNSFTTISGMAAIITQTGASAAGAAAASEHVKLPADVKRYVRGTATGSATIGDCSGDTLTVRLLT